VASGGVIRFSRSSGSRLAPRSIILRQSGPPRLDSVPNRMCWSVFCRK
jgi:hypothetical protein